MTSPVVVDGRVSREKLDELLALEAEHAELDFKATIDLSVNKHRLDIIKDCVAMMNTPTGGYLLLGVNDDGTLAVDREPLKAGTFDGADLAQAVARHVTAPPVITSKEHTVDARLVVLIHIAPTATGLPALITKIGEYEKPDRRMETVLRPGVLHTREGTRTVTATDAHWDFLLQRHRASITAETREGVDALIRRVVTSMGVGGDPAHLAPLDLQMDDGTFSEALERLIGRRDGEARIKRILRTARDLISINNDDVQAREAAMDKVAIIAVQAIFTESKGIFEQSIKTLFTPYMAVVENHAGAYRSRDAASYWLSIMVRIFCIGAAATREEAWWCVSLLVDRRVDDYYRIWVRHGLVMAARADLLLGRSREGALVLILARELAEKVPALRSDIGRIPPADDAVPVPDQDSMLDSLCQFDIVWCIYAAASHPGVSDGQLMYPSCAALQQRRAQPAITALAVSDRMRFALVKSDPFLEDSVVADGMKRVLEVAVIQSHHFGSWWPGASADPVVEHFLIANATPRR